MQFEECVSRHLAFADTTLRDGEQTPGVAFSPEEKLEIATLLDAAGINAIDAGMPIVSADERRGIRAVVESNPSCMVRALCRPLESDINAALDCGLNTIIIFIGTSDIHVNAKFSGGRDQVLRHVEHGIGYAIDHGLAVTFGCEDGSRTDLDFLVKVLNTAHECGAITCGFADTAGMMTPWQMYNRTRHVVQRVPMPVGVHCHNDFNLATANSIAAILAGAISAETTVCGIGERAGNTSFEELVLALEQLLGIRTGIDLSVLGKLSEVVQRASRIKRDPFKPIVGDHAFTHESGIHTSAILRNPLTYEPFDPAILGRRRTFVFGKHSGQDALRALLGDAGVSEPDRETVQSTLLVCKERAERGEVTSEADAVSIYMELALPQAVTA